MRPLCLSPQACEVSSSMGTFSPSDSTGRWQPRGAAVAAKVTAHDDSSSPGPCTFHRGAVGAPCSGQTHPGHPASPGVSAKRRKGPGGGGERIHSYRGSSANALAPHLLPISRHMSPGSSGEIPGLPRAKAGGLRTGSMARYVA